MKLSSRLIRPAAGCALAAVFLIPGGASACEERVLSADGLSYTGADGFILDPDFATATASSGAGGCSEPSCTDASCLTFNPSTPFVRPPGLQSSPIFQYAGCFGVAKRDDNFYVKLSMDGPAGSSGMFRHISTDGGINWQVGPVVLSPSQGWFTGMKCPDPQFLDTDGSMVVYFKGFGSGGGIGRAVSKNNGRSWTVPESGPVLTSGTPGFYVDNPSVIKRGKNNWLMAYTMACGGSTGPFQLAETYLAYSSDGINWTKSPLNPAIAPGPCGTFDHGGIANPVLVNDPNDEGTVHLFYTGVGWKVNANGVGTTRGCAKFGHAISTNYGRTWCKTGVVLDHPPAGSGAWDDVQYMVSSYTIEPNNKIRMYYWAEGTNDAALGVAEADWPLAGCPAPLHENHQVLQNSLADSDLTGLDGRPVASLRLRPNPSLGLTSIEHNLGSTSLEGPGSIKVFDIQGREVAAVWRGRLEQAPAQIEWDGRDAGGTRVANGRYLIRLETSGTPLATDWVTILR